MNYLEPKIKLVPLLPCGLPDIEHDSRYSIDQKDKVMRICAFLANTKLCTDSICRECANIIFDKLTSGHPEDRPQRSLFQI